MARNSSTLLQKSLRGIDVALDGVDKVIGSIMAIQGNASKILKLLRDLQEFDLWIPYEYYGFGPARTIYDDIRYNFFYEYYDYDDKNYLSFGDFDTILEQIRDYAYKWLYLDYPKDPRTKRTFRDLKRKIRQLWNTGIKLRRKFKPDVSVLAKRLEQKIDKLQKVSRKMLDRARGDAYMDL
ncbi:unnamed protein product [Owenia fusiformis]|nr:unnamed protein product [Owenia fusiformis]